jgi:hypothetical protein
VPDAQEAFARALHEAYVRQRLDAGEHLGSTPSLSSWNDLSHEFKESSRRNARDVRAIVTSLGYDLTLADEDSGATLSEGEVEALAERLHERWVEERQASGWRYGERREDDRRLHPDLVEWVNLPDARREIERNLGRELPFLARNAGLILVRRGPEPPGKSEEVVDGFPEG